MLLPSISTVCRFNVEVCDDKPFPPRLCSAHGDLRREGLSHEDPERTVLHTRDDLRCSPSERAGSRGCTCTGDSSSPRRLPPSVVLAVLSAIPAQSAGVACYSRVKSEIEWATGFCDTKSNIHITCDATPRVPKHRQVSNRGCLPLLQELDERLGGELLS